MVDFAGGASDFPTKCLPEPNPVVCLRRPERDKENPMRSLSCLVCTAVVAAAGAAHGQSVEFRIVEREGQNIILFSSGSSTTSDGVLNFAVQARVVGGSATQFLGTFSFNIIAPGEPDANGTLAKLLTSNVDGTYAANMTQSTNASVNRGGLAAIYCFLAGINPNFNGLINTSGGSFTNTPGNQEIGIVTGSPAGNSLLLLTDPNGTGNPATYPGTGTTAAIDPAIAATYLGAAGNFVDVYRFKYTLTDATPRSLSFNLANVTAEIGSSLQNTNGTWVPVQSSATATATGILFPFPAPASASLLVTLQPSTTARPEQGPTCAL
jgi:hypothetical protein